MLIQKIYNSKMEDFMKTEKQFQELKKKEKKNQA